jgi:hypothetical protein
MTSSSTINVVLPPIGPRAGEIKFACGAFTMLRIRGDPLLSIPLFDTSKENSPSLADDGTLHCIQVELTTLIAGRVTPNSKHDAELSNEVPMTVTTEPLSLILSGSSLLTVA